MTRWNPSDGKCTVIAEIGLAHEGSLGMAQSYIDAAASAGADAVKFQTHIAAHESTVHEQFRVPLSGQDRSRYDYWHRTSFSEDQWLLLVERAHQRGLLFLSSPFSQEAVDLLVRVKADAIKIASGEVSNLPMIRHASRSGLPILLSSGLSSFEDLDAAVDAARQGRAPIGVFQCTSSYPCPPEAIGLNVISELKQRYSCAAGLSDHSGTIYAGLAATSLGCDMIEVHVCFSKGMYGPDVPASLTIEDLTKLVEGVRFIERSLANPTNKAEAAKGMGEMRRLFTRSIVARNPLAAGTTLTEAMLAYKKPGIGIPAANADEVIGRRLLRDVETDHFFSLDDLQ